jgi:hypothetical protein
MCWGMNRQDRPRRMTRRVDIPCIIDTMIEKYPNILYSVTNISALLLTAEIRTLLVLTPRTCSLLEDSFVARHWLLL